MAVHKRGYARYEGPLTGRWARLLVLPRFAWEGMMRERRIMMTFIIALFWPAACLMMIYISNRPELLLGFPEDMLAFLRIDGTFFVHFMNSQALFAVFLASFAGPSLIAPDLANGALSLYFSRPMSRAEYILSRMLVLVGVLSPVTWIPGMALFFAQSGFAGGTWFLDNWMLGVGIFFGFLLWILLVSLVAMTSSAYVKWRTVAGGLVLGFFFVLSGAAAMTAVVLRADWPAAFNPPLAMNQIWRSMLNSEPLAGPGALQSFLAMAAISAFLLFVLDRKLRPVEVVP